MSEQEQPSSPFSGEIARWGFFVVALVLGTALLVSSITSYLGATTITNTVIRGQAQALHRELYKDIEQQGFFGPPRSETLEAFVDEHAATGVRKVAITGPRRGLIAEAGSGDPLPLMEPGEIKVRGDLAQVAFALRGPPREGKGPPPHERKGPPHDRKGPPHDRKGPHFDGKLPPHLRGKGGPRRPPIVVIEFVPEAALALRARAQRDLGVGVTVAVALMLGATVFWRMSRRAQAAEARLAAQRHLAALGEMSAVLAHEIRNPLASLKGHAQLLAEKVIGDPPLERKAVRILDETQRLEHLTNGLLDFARTTKLKVEPVDPVALLRRCAEACSGVVELELEGAPERWSFDGGKLEQVLRNLIDNAWQAAPDEPCQARVAVERGMLVFEVRDHGPGVPEEDRNRIFEPFHTTRTRGTGLGLAVSRRIIEQHGGTIDVVDAPGGGASFVVMLPKDGTS
ncbi:MAG: HAMP domain-containing sensor histidine kinase [Myxococcota bacterium]